MALASHPPQDPTISLENRDDDNIEQARGNDFEVNRKYLTFSWWLLHRGWKAILEVVEPAVRDVFGPHKPNEDVSLEKMSSLILDVRKRIEGATPEARKSVVDLPQILTCTDCTRRSHKWLTAVLPPTDQEPSVLRDAGMSTPEPSSQSAETQNLDGMPSPPSSPVPPSETPPALRRLLDETADFVESPMFSHVLTLLLDATFSQLADTRLRSEAYKLPPLGAESSSSAKVTEVTESDPATASTKLATILAVMTREAHKIGNGVPNEYVQATEGVSELEGFAAVVYSSNFEMEAGSGPGSIPDSLKTGQEDEITSTEKKCEDLSPSAEVETAAGTGRSLGIMDRASGVVDATWSGFESVWGKVVGGGQS